MKRIKIPRHANSPKKKFELIYLFLKEDLKDAENTGYLEIPVIIITIYIIKATLN